ncbi:MAG: ribosome biogenesis GTPase Der [Synergistales bacterium]|nr:ribosome biogenesis GTPase Der [Synergistales bacterium]MDY6401117.1 ribosome biogenesis GTPase Der [Synergistales bacterium]MDY6404710.1 ribosome biogenesis GTPase Der [Synergistales bacterium]MDY6410862.1 ribosome biogenesis GTPase Der [Synergistales bacterium]MDY6415155.1 ribosome biogenesis GTPase Der [Synergistales bacterium]
MPGIATIIGRPNAGKSSLFNRLTGKRDAIVDDMPGVTRDRLYGECEHRGKNFYVIDTGGIFGEDTEFSRGIKNHVDEAVKECDLIIFMLDGRDGVTSSDEEIADFIRKASGNGKPVIVAMNKLDDPKHDDLINDAYSLGFENIVPISALHKRGIDDLLDLITELLPEDYEENFSDDENEIKLVIAGKPNVGKSSLLNKITKSERSLVSPIAGTTRDPVDMTVNIDGQNFRIIDTAGLRRRSKFDGDLEYYSFVRTLSAVDRADIALLLMDAREPCTDQDKKIAAHVVQKGKGLIIVLNKWDLLSVRSEELGVRNENKADELIKKIRDDMPFLSYAPVIFASALNGRGINKIIQTVLTVNENRKKRIATNLLNRLMRDVLAFDRLPSDKKGRALKVYYCSQADALPPTFIFFVNKPELVNSSFENHVKNKLRELEDFTGTPVRTFWRGKDKD